MKNNPPVAPFASGPTEVPVPAKNSTPLRSFFRTWGNTVLWWTFALLFSLPYHGGFMMFMFALPWAIVILFYLLAVARKPAKRKIGLIKLTIGLTCLLSIWTAHKYYAYDSHAKGEAAVA